ncbi:MAG TPA: hypothetical protein VF665_15345 [Longimicrobium sp.]|jgi:hypothetical protein|uniref:hypothetical protein n=1 Tax=Longimicrobium sp. TaxID=2029185 RepID=UPI002ED7E53A
MMDELERDPLLSAALRDAAGPAPEPDWDALRGRIAARAELPLARRRAAVRAPARRAVRALLPLAAAAGIAGVAWTALTPRSPVLTPAERSEIDAAVREGLPDQVHLLLTGEAADAALLDVVDVRAPAERGG